MVYIEDKVIPSTNYLNTEALAIQEGEDYYVRHNMFPPIAEIDSLTMQNVIEGFWNCPRALNKRVDLINEWRN